MSEIGLLANIKIYDNKISLSQIKNGVESTKLVSPESLAQALAVGSKFDTGFLPCREGVVRYVKNGNKVLLYYQMPEQKRTIIYSDNSLKKTFDNMVTPWTIFPILLQADEEGNYRVVSEQAFAMKGPLMTGLDNFYRFPFTNVYEDGLICWGNNDTRSLSWKNLAGIKTHFDNLYVFPFNAHLDYGNFIPFKITHGDKQVTISNVAPLLQHLVGADTFPNEILKQATSFKSNFDNLLRKL